MKVSIEHVFFISTASYWAPLLIFIMEKKDWFKLKRYPHIGLPLKESDRSKWIESYVTNPCRIKTHSFLPFIHKTSRVRRFRKMYSNKTGNLIIQNQKNIKHVRVKEEKKRELYYSSHLDTLIYSYYSEVLNIKYESKILEYGLDEVITAYRSIPINNSKKENSNKCNIDFAKEAFDYIKDYNKDNFIAIAFDIKGFFDNLNHKIISNTWCDLLEVDKMPKDHFNVFKNITRYSYVDLVDIFEMFKEKIFVRYDSFNKEKLKRTKISKIKFLKEKNAVAFCTKKEFLSNKNKLLKNSKTIKNSDSKVVNKNFGIPQGSPISSILANSYMLEFDKIINEYITHNNGIYRRYSDDMIVVCPKETKQSIIDLIESEIQKIKLEIQTKKTQIFHFKKEEGKLVCGQEFSESINWNKNFVYLGFEFDGETILLKSASLSNYYRKMKRTVRRSKYFANNQKNKHSGNIFKRRILRRFSYKGAQRRRKWIWDKAKNEFYKSEHYDWGNFLSYVNKSAKVMKEEKIKHQTKKHWIKLENELKS